MGRTRLICHKIHLSDIDLVASTELQILLSPPPAQPPTVAIREPWRVHKRDLEAWLDIDADRRPRWQDLFGHPDGADYLTNAGKAVAARAADYLEMFFDPSWLGQAMAAGPDGVPIPTLARFTPVLTPVSPGSSAGAAGSYIELVRWWLALEVLDEPRPVPGFNGMRNDARRDIQLDRLLHVLTQTRLAAAGRFLGAAATLEPETGPRAADVLLEHGAVSVLIEVVTVAPDAAFRRQTAGTERSFTHLQQLADEHDIHWDGHVPGQLPPHQLATWRRATGDLAVQASQRQQPVSMTTADGRELTARPGAAPPGTSLIGPFIESDQGRRLLQTLRQKAAQTKHAGPAWIWVEDHGLFQPFTPFQRMPLDERVATFARLVAITAWSHAGRVRSEAAFACLAGVNPIPASSGNTTRHRLNRGGDRRLNRALHIAAVTRMRIDPDTRAYVEKRRAEGRTTKEIRRSLKRYLARQIYRHLNAAQAHMSAT